ncbi:hypothetical protein TTHERM_00079830 (macronuclear) [Tetrahymena thermophila SB210]|uniref:Kinase domain protein n=1 Tax=Tetrahymena thermophila (strain SB210) TaxID=312017 RepID=Q23FN2_TETTS|nr:hypothetical protein TTHERM_00079830 [Tetrahymena thermophila SB210]EAR95578.2 hypothetical protein TTHERM_00079830 [Tetrahymena thermophila SB210]|eukprot:XP_001015823.2 hypothetical protein TTHERM_00079830 [Tetrahymena thermophila SB210]
MLTFYQKVYFSKQSYDIILKQIQTTIYNKQVKIQQITLNFKLKLISFKIFYDIKLYILPKQINKQLKQIFYLFLNQIQGINIIKKRSGLKQNIIQMQQNITSADTFFKEEKEIIQIYANSNSIVQDLEKFLEVQKIDQENIYMLNIKMQNKEQTTDQNSSQKQNFLPQTIDLHDFNLFNPNIQILNLDFQNQKTMHHQVLKSILEQLKVFCFIKCVIITPREKQIASTSLLHISGFIEQLIYLESIEVIIPQNKIDNSDVNKLLQSIQMQVNLKQIKVVFQKLVKIDNINFKLLSQILSSCTLLQNLHLTFTRIQHSFSDINLFFINLQNLKFLKNWELNIIVILSNNFYVAVNYQEEVKIMCLGLSEPLVKSRFVAKIDNGGIYLQSHQIENKNDERDIQITIGRDIVLGSQGSQLICQQLEQIKGIKMLQLNILERNYVNEKGIKYFTDCILSLKDQLSSLSLNFDTNNQIGEDSCDQFNQILNHHQNLKQLQLSIGSGENVKDKTISIFEGVKQNKFLEKLQIKIGGYNYIGSQSLLPLESDEFKLQNLKELSLIIGIENINRAAINHLTKFIVNHETIQNLSIIIQESFVYEDLRQLTMILAKFRHLITLHFRFMIGYEDSIIIEKKLKKNKYLVELFV